MALNLMLGEKKSGKTTFILESLKDNKNATVIVPEHNLFVYETLILDRLGEESSFLINTLSFKKLAVSLIKDEEEYNSIKLLDNDTRDLIVEQILLNNKDDMTALKKAVAKPDFSRKISEQISEFKKYLITGEDIDKLIKSGNLEKSLKEKLSDLNSVYKKYEEQVKSVFKDTDDILTHSAKKIIKEKIFCKKTIYIDGFTGFTKDELFMIEAFLSNGAEVYVSLPYLDKKGKNPFDLYYSVKKTIDKLKIIAEKGGILVKEIDFTDDYTICDEIKFIKKNYGDDSKKYSEEVKNIHICACKNVQSECANLVSLIVKNLKDSSLRLDDILVILPDIKKYLKYLEPELKEFNLSYYCNEKVSVYDLSVAMLINNLFDIILSSNRLDVILSYIKSGYFYKDNPDKIYRFENFIRETGIRAYTLMNKPFSDIIEEKKTYDFVIENEEELTEVYKKVILPAINLKENLKNEKTALNYSLCLYGYFKEINLEETIISYCDDYEKDGDIIKGDQLIQVYNYIVESMERASLVLSDCEIDFKEYKDIIICALKNKNIASVPVLNDSIMLCDLNGFCANNYKQIYILGTAEGKIPDTSFTEGLINEEERKELLTLGVEMSMNYELKLSESWLKLYDALISAEDKLYISYPVFDKNGEESTPAEFVSDLCEMFDIKAQRENTEIISKRELLKEALLELSQKKEISDSFKYLAKDGEYREILENTIKNFDKKTVRDVKISEDKIKKLLGDRLNLSATNLEKYRQCGYSYFLRYIMRAKEKNEFSINNANLGSLLHSVIEKFSYELKKDNLTFDMADESYIENKLDKIIKKAVTKADNGVFITDKKAQFILKRVKRSAVYVINLLKLHFDKGSFVPMGYEVGFGKKEDAFDGVTFDIGDGRKVVLNGIVDRVDKLTSDDGEYIRIIDYKSSGKTVDFYEIFSGIKIQLAVYLLAMLDKKITDKIKPGGMMYLTLDTPIIKIENALDKEDLEIRIRKEHIMKGIFLNNDDVLIAMDSELENSSKSEIIDVSFDKSGKINSKNALSLGEFEKMLTSVCDTVKKEAEGIFDGQFKIYPAISKSVDSCAYCPYIPVCMYESGICDCDVIEKLSREELFKEEESEENE